MTRRDDGGPAFGHGDPTNGGCSGMSLRDWFAGQALQGIGVWSPVGPMLNDLRAIESRAEWAYAQADAMIDALRK